MISSHSPRAEPLFPFPSGMAVWTFGNASIVGFSISILSVFVFLSLFPDVAEQIPATAHSLFVNHHALSSRGGQPDRIIPLDEKTYPVAFLQRGAPVPSAGE